MSAQLANALSCNTAVLKEILASINAGNDKIDHEVITTAWICDEGGTDNWIRTITAYIDGVAQAPQTVDSGIACTDPAPAAVITADIELVCNATTGFYDSYVHIITDGVPAAPVVTATATPCSAPTQVVTFPSKCISVDGGASQYATPANFINTNTGLSTGKNWFDENGDLIAGVVAVLDDCDCIDCDKCGDVTGCMTFAGHDYYAISEFTAGQTSTFEVLLDGVIVATPVIDYLAADTGMKSSWYALLNTAIDATGVFAVSIRTDVPSNDDGGRPIWQMNYSGAGSQSLEVRSVDGLQSLIFNADGSGAMTGSIINFGVAAPDFGTPQFDTIACV